MAVQGITKLNEAKERAKAAAQRPRPQAYSLTESDPTKLLVYGHSGSGKTFVIVGCLIHGERVLVLSTDFGSNGLKTVKNELRKRGKLNLLNNLRVLDLASYEDIEAFLKDPTPFVPDLAEFDPTVLVWEGFSTFNIDILDEYILSHAPSAEGAGELRRAGLAHNKQDWQGMKRGTVRGLRYFFAFVLPNGKQVHKILTCLEAQPETDELTQKTQRSVLVHGTGKSLMAPGFDVIIEVFKEESKDGLVNYFYRCDGDSQKYLLKNRGFELKPVEPADPVRLWSILTDKPIPQEEGVAQ